MKTRNREKGVTLLEMLLVLAIAAAILLMGLRQYQIYREDVNGRLLMANVNMLMQAVARFYQANCYGQTSPSGGLVVGTGRLNPENNPQAIYVVNIPVRLVADGYLSTNIATIFPLNPIVESGGATYGYVAQLNSYPQNRLLCTEGSNAVLGVNDPSCSSKRQTGSAVIWKIQISVLVRDQAKADLYKNMLGADCLSSYSGSVVRPCSMNQPGPYLVWERLPSSIATGSENIGSASGMNQMVNQFTQMYRTYSPQLTAGVPAGYYPSPTGNNRAYFVCGS